MKTLHRTLLLSSAAVGLLFLAACGNKGPLVMPQKPVPVEEQQVEPVDGDTPVDDGATQDATPVEDGRQQDGGGNG